MNSLKLRVVDKGVDRKETVWTEVARVARPIVVDIAVFVLILLALLLGFLGLRVLQAAGYDKDKLHAFAVMHYWCYAAVYALFGIDLLFKITLAVFFRNRVGRKATDK